LSSNKKKNEKECQLGLPWGIELSMGERERKRRLPGEIERIECDDEEDVGKSGNGCSVAAGISKATTLSSAEP
jgi:hypothetical protein